MAPAVLLLCVLLAVAGAACVWLGLALGRARRSASEAQAQLATQREHATAQAREASALRAQLGEREHHLRLLAAAEDQHRLYEFVLNALSDPVGVLDMQRNYRLVNDAWLAANQRSRAQTLGRNLREVFPQPVSPERLQALQACLDEGREQLARGVSPHPSRRDRLLETRYFPFREPASAWQGAVMVSRDITELEAARADLDHSLDNLRLTLNSVGDAIFATDAGGPDDPVLFANEPLLAMWGIPADEAKPLTARTIMRHATPQFAEPEAQVARVQEIIANNLDALDRVPLKDGRVFLRRCACRPHAPRPVRVWVFRDITAEVQATQSLAASVAQQRALLDAFPGYIWVFNAEHRVLHMNAAASSVYLPWQPRPKVSAATLFGPEVYDRVRPLLEQALGGQTVSVDWHRPSRSGRTPEHLLVKMVPGQSLEGERLAYVFGIDISPQKRAQAELEAAKEEAERANRAKTQFLSSMSHELRTPLNAVIGFAHVLQQNIGGTMTPRQLQQAGDIGRAGEHLLALINDLLDIARIEAGHVEVALETVALDPLIAECLQLMQPLAAREGCTLEVPPAGAGEVRADPMRLKQVLINLLSNAIKYNRPQGGVRVGWHVAGADLCIEVIDEGAGIPDEVQPRLFKAFERLEIDGRRAEGTGIGLALSRHLVEQMHGQIGVRSRVGQGSCFWVRVRRIPTREHPLRLLYVDDNHINLALMESLLETEPQLQLRTCADPGAALDSLSALPVDLLLLDLHMPGMDGFELLRRVRADGATRTLPALAVSADATRQTLERCRTAGFAEHVAKPVSLERMLAAIGRAIDAGPALTEPADRPTAA